MGRCLGQEGCRCRAKAAVTFMMLHASCLKCSFCTVCKCSGAVLHKTQGLLARGSRSTAWAGEMLCSVI